MFFLFALFSLPASTKSHSTRKHCLLTKRNPLYFLGYFLPVFYFFSLLFVCSITGILEPATFETHGTCQHYFEKTRGTCQPEHYFWNARYLPALLLKHAALGTHAVLSWNNWTFLLVAGKWTNLRVKEQQQRPKGQWKCRENSRMDGGSQKIKRCKGSILVANHDVERALICNPKG